MDKLCKKICHHSNVPVIIFWRLSNFRANDLSHFPVFSHPFLYLIPLKQNQLALEIDQAKFIYLNSTLRRNKPEDTLSSQYLGSEILPGLTERAFCTARSCVRRHAWPSVLPALEGPASCIGARSWDMNSDNRGNNRGHWSSRSYFCLDV